MLIPRLRRGQAKKKARQERILAGLDLMPGLRDQLPAIEWLLTSVSRAGAETDGQERW